ncbi:BLOC-1-related complex subunit 5-like [Oppia nitens]|uniref:BLOC-1-related complex subunit 5-like n=1 Tax=Oppia nitens TaxID=1686743 RepID=UPI0023DBDC9B|nr:BLOC-1-related complex subunit 5-like [Oppia nitens]
MGSHLSKNPETYQNRSKADLKINTHTNSRRKSSVDSVSTPDFITSQHIKAIGGQSDQRQQQIVGHKSEAKIWIPAEIVVVSDAPTDSEDIITFPPTFKPLIPIGYESLSQSYPQLKPEFIINLGLILEKHLKTKAEFVAREQLKLIDCVKDLDSKVSYLSNQFIVERQKRLIKVSENLSKVTEISSLIEKIDKDLDICVKSLDKLNNFLPQTLQLEKLELNQTTVYS